MAVFNFSKADAHGNRLGWVRFVDRGMNSLMTFEVPADRVGTYEVTKAAAKALHVIRKMGPEDGVAQVNRGGLN